MICPRPNTEVAIRDFSNFKLKDVSVVEAYDLGK